MSHRMTLPLFGLSSSDCCLIRASSLGESYVKPSRAPNSAQPKPFFLFFYSSVFVSSRIPINVAPGEGTPSLGTASLLGFRSVQDGLDLESQLVEPQSEPNRPHIHPRYVLCMLPL